MSQGKEEEERREWGGGAGQNKKIRWRMTKMYPDNLIMVLKTAEAGPN